MQVRELIKQLEKVQHKEAIVFVCSSDEAKNLLSKVIIEHDLKDDRVVVVLKQFGYQGDITYDN